MKQTTYILSIFLLLICSAAFAIPAKKGPVTLRQPDGTTFKALLRGDEFTRIKTTAEGHAIIQDEEGWWCYALYENDGRKYNSGWRVNGNVPSDILSSSRNIPYASLSETADRFRKQVMQTDREPLMRRLLEKGGSATKGEGEEKITKHGLVILAAFNDVSFTYTKKDFVNMLIQEGYSANGATGSAKEYFDAQFNGKVDFDFHVSNIVKLPRNRAYYGSNGDDGTDKYPAEMIRDACKEADAEIDFSLFDDDNDGKVDNIFLFFAGEDEAEGASEECIWSHSWYIYSGAGIELELDGKMIDRYACSSELRIRFDQEGNTHESMAGIGTFCHEYSHTFGLPDFYDTDYENEGGVSAGLWGSTSLMDSGNYNNTGNTPPYYNAIERWILGIDQPVLLAETGTYTLSPINEGKGFYIMETDQPGEIYILECREEKGWDSYIRGNGMLVYHIDKTEEVTNSWLYTNDLNCNPAHQCADLIEADARADSYPSVEEYAQAAQSIKGIFFPYGNTDSITSDTNPCIEFWSGNKSPMSITGITRNENEINFNFLLNKDEIGPPIPSGIEKETFADAAIIRFESSYIYEGEAVVKWGRTGYEDQVTTVMPYESGKYALILENLEHSGKTYSATISFTLNGMEGEKRSISFMTKRMPTVKWPYIYLGSMERNSDGTFPSGSRHPLRVYGATGAEQIIWYFNGKEIKHDGDGYFTIPGDGTISASVYWEDGSIDMISKEITISKE